MPITQLQTLEVRDRFQVSSMSEFVQIQEMPLTSDGEVDCITLLEQATPGYLSSAAHVAPRTELEQIIAAAWKEVLHVEKVSASDNFFDLGGSSLLVAQVQSKLKEALGVDLAMAEFLQYPTLSALAKELEKIAFLDAPQTESTLRT
jgi:acyl carrier protein